MAQEGFSITQELVRSTTTLVSVFIASKMAIRTYKANKQWDARREVYEEVCALLEKLQMLVLGAWTHQMDLADGKTTESPAFKHNQKDAAEFETSLEDLHKLLSHKGRIYFSPSTYRLLSKLHSKFYRYSTYDAHKIKEGPFGLIEEDVELFYREALSHLEMLTWSERLEPSLNRISRVFSVFLLRSIFWFSYFFLVVLFGLEKGRRKADVVGEALQLFGFYPPRVFYPRNVPTTVGEQAEEPVQNHQESTSSLIGEGAQR